MAWYSKTYTLLTSIHKDLDDADHYSRVIGISKCEQKIANTHPNKHMHTQTSELGDYHKLSLWLSLMNNWID